MLRIKAILFSGICIFYFTALSAQLVRGKNKSNTNAVNDRFYQEEFWNSIQLPKTAILYQNNSKYMPEQNLTSVPRFDLWHAFPHLSIAERLRSKMQTNMILSFFYYRNRHSCIYFKKYRNSLDELLLPNYNVFHQ